MFDLNAIRLQFPGFSRTQSEVPVVFFDGPAGSQVPQSVIDAVAHYLANTNSNCGAAHATSQESDAMLVATRAACADFLNAPTTDEIVFGPNMTTLTFALSRALARNWFVGDEIILSRLDHDANVSPWIIAAREAGVVVNQIDFDLTDCTLDLDHYLSLLSNRTKLVAVGAASNATGTINPVREIVRYAKSVGAISFVDAVHYAPHRLIDVQDFDCDFLACSGYKFFGPHVGVMWGRRELLESLRPDKLRPAPSQHPGKWMTGTQNHEGLAGLQAAINYLASLEEPETRIPRRPRLAASFEEIEAHEQQLSLRLLEGLEQISTLKIWGITNREEIGQRVPTYSVTHTEKSPQALAAELARQGIFTWAGNHYALPFTEFAGLEPHGTLRIGLLHYNTMEEVERLLNCLKQIC